MHFNDSDPSICEYRYLCIKRYLHKSVWNKEIISYIYLGYEQHIVCLLQRQVVAYLYCKIIVQHNVFMHFNDSQSVYEYKYLCIKRYLHKSLWNKEISYIYLGCEQHIVCLLQRQVVAYC